MATGSPLCSLVHLVASGLAAMRAHELLAPGDRRDLAQGLAKRGKIDRLAELRIDDEAKGRRKADLVLAVFALCTTDQENGRARIQLSQEGQDLVAGSLAERQIEGNAIEAPLLQNLYCAFDRVYAGRLETLLRRDLAQNRQMNVSIFDYQQLIAHAIHRPPARLLRRAKRCIARAADQSVKVRPRTRTGGEAAGRMVNATRR